VLPDFHLAKQSLGWESVGASYRFSGILRKYSKGALGTQKHEVASSQELFNCLVAAFQDGFRQKLLPEFLTSFAISADLMSNGHPYSYYIDGIFCSLFSSHPRKIWGAS